MKNWMLLSFAALAMSFPIRANGEVDVAVKVLRFEPTDGRRDREVPLKVYWDGEPTPKPVILFSHGLGGSRENNAYLGEYWASSGYVAVFMQHAGSDEQVWKTARLRQRMAALKSAASLQSSQDRIEDVTFVIDQLTVWNKQKSHPLSNRMDLEHIGMSGHSFGAVTTLAVAGQKLPRNRSFEETRIDAFVAFSPQPGKGLPADQGFGHLAKPMMCMTGTKDASPIDSSFDPAKRREVYAALPEGDKYELVLDGAEHSAFGDSRGLRTRNRNPKHHPAIQQISLRFWDAYLKEDASAKTWLQSDRPLSETGLSDVDVWSWK
ncbi:MAG TPA: acetylhydrolase [Rhodopirellula baltica]|nr:acetylhydrolase [Rhodopirellula baltica]HBE62940.1 acetylhydrolase [Rhodopirellula baltica]